MEVNPDTFYLKMTEIDFNWIKSNDTLLNFFYFMTPRKTCNCRNKPKVRTQEAFQQAFNIYIELENSLSKSTKNELKKLLQTETITFKNLTGETIFVL